jgi:hypothetical protein
VTAGIATARAPVIGNHSQISRDATASFTVRAPADRAEFVRSFTELETINDKRAAEFWKEMAGQ